MKLSYPIKLEFSAEELDDENWHMSYKEYFNPDHLEAFKNSYELAKQVPNIDVSLDKENCMVAIKFTGSRTRVFDFLCGEFFGLSSLSKKTLMELFIYAGIGALSQAKE